jgi:hypothetical protein
MSLQGFILEVLYRVGLFDGEVIEKEAEGIFDFDGWEGKLSCMGQVYFIAKAKACLFMYGPKRR